MSENIKSIAGISFLIIISLISALYGVPELDEGYFIQLAKSMSQGARVYIDIPAMYGPLFLKINQIIFSTFGFLHFTSRISAFTVGLLTFFVMVLCVKKSYKNCLAWSLVCPAIWLLTSAQRFSESLHPGWYIALLLIVQAFLLMTKPRYQFLGLGICSGLLLGFKPHIALLGVVAIFQIVVLRNKSSIPSPLRYIPFLMLSFLMLMILRSVFLVGSFSYLLPFCLTTILFLASLHYSKLEIGNFKKDILGYLLALIAISSSIYLIAGYEYGFNNIKYSLLDLPSQWFPDFYGDHSSEPLIIRIIIYFFYLFVGIAIFSKSKTLINFSIYLLPFGLIEPSLFSIHVFFLIHIALYLKFFEQKKETILALILLSISQIFHMHPVVGTQVYYSSPITWLLLACCLNEDSKANTLFYSRMKLLLCTMCLYAIYCLPIAQTIIRGENIVFLPSKLKNNEYILIGNEESQFFVQLVEYFQPKLSEHSTLLTIPRYDSINLLLNVFPSTHIESYYFRRLGPEELNKIAPSLFSTDYVALFPSSNRAKNVLDSEVFMNTLMKYQEPVIEDDKAENHFSRKVLQVLKKKKTVN